MRMRYRTQAILWFVMAIAWVWLSQFHQDCLWVAGGCAAAGVLALSIDETPGEG